jgi:hypothetical protein
MLSHWGKLLILLLVFTWALGWAQANQGAAELLASLFKF